MKKWLAILIAPGSSLGGARPKANITDDNGHLWIAKFPSKTDTIDKGAWEYLAYKLALECGINMPESRIEKVQGNIILFLPNVLTGIKATDSFCLSHDHDRTT